ncbi:hypothetical protein AFE_2997 [Acidithiobacillus ferrooxidans ATCC 23270]|uniref:Uncharacterized protein n=1 Tax=Acidithiobacillus ferrooxidans (strain ATCC 23270 / DSM 14882 / CIP 104768 / NCIMB 8455) TaxID=243159 RepID=B7J9X0_ACIF2|nr:hypothetical protein AFE_2997 [Acidithiobacillus ferrooxidans ATCC 23270]
MAVNNNLLTLGTRWSACVTVTGGLLGFEGIISSPIKLYYVQVSLLGTF